MHTILAIRDQVIAAPSIDSRVPCVEIVKTETGVLVYDRLTDVAGFNGVELVTPGVVVRGANGRDCARTYAVGAAGVHVVAGGLIDCRVELKEPVRSNTVGGGDGVTGSRSDKIGLSTVGNQSRTGPVPSYKASGLQIC